MEESVNVGAYAKVREIIDRCAELRCSATELKNGATLIDAGVNVEGSHELGRLIGEACMGGLGSVRITQMHIAEMTLPAVVVGTNRPVIATMGSQFAGWSVKSTTFSAMASGPARALALKESGLFEKLGYRDDSKIGVVVLETRQLPDERVLGEIASACCIDPSGLYCIVVPTASLAGSVQIAARIVEVGVHKMHLLGYSLDGMRTGHGVAPIAPVASSDAKAMGVTNDCILYAGRVYFYLRPTPDGRLEELVNRVPSSASSQYGQPFYKLFKSVGFDFYKIDPNLFSPAEVTLVDLTNERTYRAGKTNPDVLRESLKAVAE
ncbi:MAG: methenyltetrahydromethanopterin cyclohydrolase [Candidatus Thorarchaeota archaeon]|nr:methenyltetrahydromethanopterin cyclohydrolase [Candidatus Thorarchaeota archaeon]